MNLLLSERTSEPARHPSFASDVRATRAHSIMMDEAFHRAGKILRNRWGLIIRFAFAVSLTIALLLQIRIEHLLKVLGGTLWCWVVIAFGLLAGADLLHTFRFRFLLRIKLKFMDLFPVVVVQRVANTMLPLRAGEASYLYLLREQRVPLTRSAASLIWARMADLLAILSLTGILGLYLGGNYPWVGKLNLLLIVGAIVGCCILLLVHYKGTWFVDLLSRGTSEGAKATFLSRTFLVFREALQAIPSLEAFLANIGLSTMTWVIVSIAPYFLFKALRLDLDFGSVLYAALLLQFIGFLPLWFLGGLGIIDISWTVYLCSQGMSFQRAAEFALASHTLYYGFVFLQGISGWSLLSIGRVRSKPEDKRA